MRLTIQGRIGSFGHAIRGVGTLLRSQPNAWLHLGATVVAMGLGWAFSISRGEWIAVLLAIGLVWTAEALNTAIEFLADEVTLERRALIGKAKDVGAAGVLLASSAALVIGLVIFVPRILAIIHHHDP